MSSPTSWVLHIDPSVARALKKFQRPYAEAIFEVIRLMPVSPFFGDIQRMKGEENVWRRRIGAYRLFYKVLQRERAILIFHVERRTSKTY